MEVALTSAHKVSWKASSPEFDRNNGTSMCEIMSAFVWTKLYSAILWFLCGKDSMNSDALLPDAGERMTRHHDFGAGQTAHSSIFDSHEKWWSM